MKTAKRNVLSSLALTSLPLAASVSDPLPQVARVHDAPFQSHIADLVNARDLHDMIFPKIAGSVLRHRDLGGDPRNVGEPAQGLVLADRTVEVDQEVECSVGCRPVCHSKKELRFFS